MSREDTSDTLLVLPRAPLHDHVANWAHVRLRIRRTELASNRLGFTPRVCLIAGCTFPLLVTGLRSLDHWCHGSQSSLAAGGLEAPAAGFKFLVSKFLCGLFGCRWFSRPEFQWARIRSIWSLSAHLTERAMDITPLIVSVASALQL